MRLATLEKFRALIYAPDSAPTLRTLRNRNRRHQIAGGVIDETGRHWVDLDEYDRQHNLRASVADKLQRLEKSPLLESLL